MKSFKLRARTILIGFTVLFLSNTSVSAGEISFSGPLRVIDLDTGGGVYSGVSIGTIFSGFIDDVSFNGEISDGTTTTTFDCCIAAGALDVTDNAPLKKGDAAFFNNLTESSFFSSGDTVDIINIETDTDTAVGGEGRIEMGISYIFAKDTFSNNSPSNYPFDSNDVLLSLFFMVEEDEFGEEIYSAVGLIYSSIPGAMQSYDSFNAKKYSGCKFCINSELWRGGERGNHNAEVLRDIRSKRANLTHTSWGRSDSDEGTEQGRNRLIFRDSANFSGACFTPRVRKYRTPSCDANDSHSQVRIRYLGNFFDTDNADDGGEDGLVYVGFALRRGTWTDEKKGIFEVDGWVSECEGEDCDSEAWSSGDVEGLDLHFGTVKASKNNKQMCVGYDRDNHEFVFSFGKDIRKVNSDHGLPALDDDVDADWSWHVIETRTDIENCTAGKLWGSIDADFDNVKVKTFDP